jgi:hypothetical protein
MWDLISAYLETMLVSLQDSCTVCAERNIGSEIVYDTPMELRGDVGHAEPYFGPFGDSVSVGATYVHILRLMYHRLINDFACTRWNS